MYDSLTPEQWIYGTLIGLIVISVLTVILFRLTLPHPPHQPLMSKPLVALIVRVVRCLVHVLVAATSTAVPISESAVGGIAPVADPDLPDTGELNAGTDDWDMPRLSRHNTNRELIIYLALQVGPDGKQRFSANDICSLMKKLPRADVLATVRQVRERPAAYPPATPEQEATRARLGLDDHSVQNGEAHGAD